MAGRNSIFWTASIVCLGVLAVSVVVVIVSAFYIDWRVISRTPVAGRVLLSAMFLSCGMAALGGTFFVIDRGIAPWPSFRKSWRREDIPVSRKDEPAKFWGLVVMLGVAGLGAVAGAIMAVACNWMPVAE